MSGDPESQLLLDLPHEFLTLCRDHKIKPATVLRGFIADLCGLVSYAIDPRKDGYSSNGSDERLYAQRYYARCGYGMQSGGDE